MFSDCNILEQLICVNCLESRNITQNVQTAIHLHSHILDLVLTPTDASVISNVRVAEFISDHALVLAQLDSVNPPSHKAKVVTFRRHHKIDMDSFCKDLGHSAFVNALVIQSVFCVNNT